MQDLVGQCFSLAEGRYRIVDVRNLAGESMIYAEKLQEDRRESAGPAAGHRHQHPQRAAFHYNDIAQYLAGDRSA